MSTAVYLDQIIKLVELQKVDDAIFDIKQQLDSAPRELEQLEHKFFAIEDKRNHILDKLSHLQEQKKRLSLEIDDDSARIKKSKNKLMQVENTREYHAMMREMDSMEKINRTREEQKLTLLEELENQTSAYAEINKEYEDAKEQLDTFNANLDKTVKENNDKLEVLAKKRYEVSDKIPKPVFMRYEFIRERLEHPVIVGVRDGICTGCNIAIPPQSFIELQGGKQILSCPNCQRLIFWEEHFDDPSISGKNITQVTETQTDNIPEQ